MSVLHVLDRVLVSDDCHPRRVHSHCGQRDALSTGFFLRMSMVDSDNAARVFVGDAGKFVAPPGGGTNMHTRGNRPR